MFEQGLARYELAVPEFSNPDSSGRTIDLSHLLEDVLHELSKLGFPNATVKKGANGIWTNPDSGERFDESMTGVTIDAADTPENDALLHEMAGEIADAADQDAVYYVKMPLARAVVKPKRSGRIKLRRLEGDRDTGYQQDWANWDSIFA